MLPANQIKYIKSLSANKGRNMHNYFIAEGIKIVNELIFSNFFIDKIYLTPLIYEKYFDTYSQFNIQIVSISEAEMQRISQQTTPPGILALVKIPDPAPLPTDFSYCPVLVLDEIKDPGNLGTIIRSADWFGLSDIICSENSVDVYNPKVVQATMGSVARVRIHYTQLDTFFASLPFGINIYGSFLNGEKISAIKLDFNGIIIIGNESRGISNFLLPYITKKIKIPYGNRKNISDKAESLNASIATAIILYEFCRQG